MALPRLRVPRLNRSICGLSLETGAKLVACYHLLVVSSLLFLACYFILTGTLNHDLSPYSPDKADFNTVFFRSEAVIATVVNMACASSLLLYGIIKKKAKWMEPYLWTKGVLLVVFLLDLLNGVLTHLLGLGSPELYFFLALSGLNLYMYCIVYNLYRDFKEKFGETVV